MHVAGVGGRAVGRRGRGRCVRGIIGLFLVAAERSVDVMSVRIAVCKKMKKKKLSAELPIGDFVATCGYMYRGTNKQQG